MKLKFARNFEKSNQAVIFIQLRFLHNVIPEKFDIRGISIFGQNLTSGWYSVSVAGPDSLFSTQSDVPSSALRLDHTGRPQPAAQGRFCFQVPFFLFTTKSSASWCFHVISTLVLINPGGKKRLRCAFGRWRSIDVSKTFVHRTICRLFSCDCGNIPHCSL